MAFSPAFTSIIQGALPGSLKFVTDTDAGYVSGQAIRFFSVTKCFTPGHLVRDDPIFQIPFTQHGFFRTAPNKGIFCYACLEPPARVFFHHYPDFKAVGRIDGVASVELLDIALTYTKLLITLTGRLENQVKIWNWENASVLCSLSLADLFVPNIELSLSTWNWREFAVVGNNSIRLFTIDQGAEDENIRAVINQRPFQLPYSRNCTPKQPSELFQCLNTGNPDDFFSLEAVAQIPASMVEVFTDEVLDRIRTIPTAHTWHVDGGVYVGTSEGSIFYFHPHHPNTLPVLLNLDVPAVPVTAIVTSKEGIAFTHSLQELRFAWMDSPTDIRCVTLPMAGEEVEQLWQVPRSDRWLVLTSTAKVCSFLPGDEKATVLYNRREMARFLTIGKFFDGSLFTLQEQGILKVWNTKDEPEFTHQLAFDATTAVASPIMDCLAVGSRNGYVHILDCTYCHNGQQPRLLHSVRLFSSALAELRFDVSGTVLLVSANSPADKLIVLSGLPSKNWKTLGMVSMPGPVTEFHGVKDDEDNVFVAVGVATGPNSKIGTELISFRLCPALCEDPAPFHCNLLDEFTEACIIFKRLKIKVPFRTFAVESHSSIFFATETKHLIHAKSDTWSRTPTVVTGTASLKFPISHLLFLPEIEHLLVVDNRGCFSVRFVGFVTEVSKDDVWLGEVDAVSWRQDYDGFHVYVTTRDGQLICRTTPYIPELETDSHLEVNVKFTAEIELMKSLPTAEPDLVGPYESATDKVVLEDLGLEAWITMKSRLCQEQTEAENTVRAITLRAKFTLLKEQMLALYEKNVHLNGIFRLQDEYFEILDEGWVQLRKKRELEIGVCCVDAHLELIRGRLMKEKLLRRFSHRLATQRQAIYGVRRCVKISNFPVPKRTPAVSALERHVAFQRYLDEELDKIADNRPRKPSEQPSINAAAGDASSSVPDYVTEVMQALGGENTENDRLFIRLHHDDKLTSRWQRIQQVTMLRECELLVKDAFNRHFDQLSARKVTLRETLSKKMDLIKRKLQSHETDLSVPTMDLAVRNDEDPQKIIYQVTDDQLLEYLKEQSIPIPLVLDRRDRNYGLSAGDRSIATGFPAVPAHRLPSAHRSHHKLASRLAIKSPADNILKSTSELIQECDSLIHEFDKDLLELMRLKDRTVFAVGVIELRAMHLRQRILQTEELSSWSRNITLQSQKLQSRLQINKASVSRARRIFDHIRQEYDKFIQTDAALDHYVKRELHEVSDLDGRMLVQIYRKRPHPLRGLKQVQHYKGQAIRPRTSELKEKMTGQFFDTLEEIEDTKHRPEEIDLKTWMKFCELRRKKMESEMTFWMKHVELEFHHGVLKDHLAVETALQSELDKVNLLASHALRSRANLARNSDFVLTLSHGQVETDCRPFMDYNSWVVLIPLSRIEGKNLDLQLECQKKMDMLNELVKYREAITLLEWEKEVHTQKIRDYEYERQFIESQAAPLELRHMVGKDFGEYREEKYQQLKQSLKQQKMTFKNDTRVWREKVQVLEQKLVAFQHERHNAEATMRGLTIELQERHTIGESIGIHADASESEMRQALVLKRLRLQTRVKSQKKRMEHLRQVLWKWQRRTFPAIYRDIRNG